MGSVRRSNSELVYRDWYILGRESLGRTAQWQIQDFPGGANSQSGYANLLFEFFSETVWKWKNLPPMQLMGFFSIEHFQCWSNMWLYLQRVPLTTSSVATAPSRKVTSKFLCIKIVESSTTKTISSFLFTFLLVTFCVGPNVAEWKSTKIN